MKNSTYITEVSIRGAATAARGLARKARPIVSAGVKQKIVKTATDPNLANRIGGGIGRGFVQAMQSGSISRDTKRMGVRALQTIRGRNTAGGKRTGGNLARGLGQLARAGVSSATTYAKQNPEKVVAAGVNVARGVGRGIGMKSPGGKYNIAQAGDPYKATPYNPDTRQATTPYSVSDIRRFAIDNGMTYQQAASILLGSGSPG